MDILNKTNIQNKILRAPEFGDEGGGGTSSSSSNVINIGGVEVDKFYLGNSADVKIFLGDVKLYPRDVSYKLVAQHSDLTEYKVVCDTSPVLTSAETKADSASASTRNVVIGDCVTELGPYSLSSFSNLTGVTFPSGMTTIGERAFDSAHGITSLTLPNSVVTINDSAFRHMHGLTQLNIPSGVTTIPNMCFNDCLALSSITIPANITAISGSAFSFCTALKEVHFEGTTPPAMGAGVFSNCTSLEKIYIPSCNYYDAYAASSQLSAKTDLIYAEDLTKCHTTYNFKMYRKLKNGVTMETACGSSSALTSGDVRSNYTMQVLTSSTSGLSEVIVGDCVSSISSRAMTGMTQLTSITFSDSVKTIADSGCMLSITAGENKLHDIDLGKVSTIGKYAFKFCGNNYSTNQPKIKFPNTLTSIGTQAFYYGKYNELTFMNGGNCDVGESAFTESASYSGVSIATDSLRRLSGYTFYGFSGLTSVSLSGVTFMATQGRHFAVCKDLTDIEIIGDGSVTIPQYCIGGGGSVLTAVTLGGISSMSNIYAINSGAGGAGVIRKLTMLDTTPPSIGATSISSYAPTVIYVPASAVDSYKTATTWKNYKDIIQAIS